jgi:peptidoglycan hydrolase CwlO-like protein
MRPYFFPTLVMLTALCLAFGAGLFTVIGFRELFQPTFNITYMAIVIEVGKVMCVSVLYQFRFILNWIWKSVIFALVIVAMAVTSMGVYGYLSSSYQKDSLAITQNDARLTLLDKRKAVLESRLDGMDAQIADVPETYPTKRMELIDKFAPERENVLGRIDALDQEKLDLTMERIDKESEFGGVILLAESVEGLDASKAMLYFILAVIFIFDPMAIALTYAANVGYYRVASKSDNSQSSPTPADTEGSPSNKDGTNWLLEKMNDFLQRAEDDKKESTKTMDSIATSVKRVSDDLDDLKSQKPVDVRSKIVDSMRNQTS